MLQPNLVASAVPLIMLVACGLAVGFMVRFFVALAGEENKTGMMHQVRPREVHYATDSGRALPRWAAVDSGVHIVMGVLRITTALAASPGRGGRRTADRSNVVVLVGPDRDSTTACRYRSS
jgi:hypothetical protein